MKSKSINNILKIAVFFLAVAATFSSLISPLAMAEPAITNLGSGFVNPKSVAVDNSGNIYVLDGNSSSIIKKMDASGDNISTLFTYNESLNSIALDSSGNIYATVSRTDSYVIKLDKNGTFLTALGLGLKNPEGLAVDSSGNIYVADTGNNAVKKIAKDSINAQTIFFCYQPFGITVASGKIYVVSLDVERTLKILNLDGSELITFSTRFNAPKSVAVDSNGYIYVADSANDVIQIMNASGGHVLTLSSGFASPYGLAIDNNDSLYVTNYNGNVVMKMGKEVDVAATTVVPTVGTDNTVTLTVKSLVNETDTSINGTKNVIISGVLAAPDGSYGSFNGVDLDASSETGQSISVSFTDGVANAALSLNSAKAQTIAFNIEGVSTSPNNVLSITPVHESAASLAIAQNIDNPSVNGGVFAQQPIVNLLDKYGNLCTNDNSTEITASKKDTGDWLLDGTVTITAVAGEASFTDLRAINNPQVINAQLAFNALDLPEVKSKTVTLPIAEYKVSYYQGDHGTISNNSETVNYESSPAAVPTVTADAGYAFDYWSSDGGVSKLTPAEVASETIIADISYTAYYYQVATAVAASNTPLAGADNTITLTVLDPSGAIDTSFSGAKNVTIAGVQAAPNHTYGRFNTIDLAASSETGQVISVTFTEGVAHPALSLNKAGAQAIAFDIEGLSTPSTSLLSITPTPEKVDYLEITQNITVPLSNGGNFNSQPQVTLKDAYSNICTNDSSTEITASKNDSGDWSLAGTTTITAVAGEASFTDLRAINNPQVTNARLAFKALDLEEVAEVMSTTITLPIAEYTVTYNEGDHGTVNSNSETVEYLGSPASVPTVTAAAGYEFAYWSSDGGVNTLTSTDLASEVITADITYTAYYVKLAVMATAEADTLEPAVGADITTTLTVKNSFNMTDTSFSGLKNVTISGVLAAPNGTYGGFNGIELNVNSTIGQTISVSFTDGVARPTLRLNKAGAQTIAFSIAGLITANTNNLSLTPTPETADFMEISQDITSEGGSFDRQPIVFLKDIYGNIATDDSSTQVTASKKDPDVGYWLLTGTSTITAVNGVITFTDLAAVNGPQIEGAQIAFKATGLAEVLSAMVTLPVNTDFEVDNYLFAWGSNGSAESQFDKPNKMAVDTAGNVYVADTNNNRIQKFSTEGAYLTQWGSAGSADGEFSTPHGVAVDGKGNVYVADTGNNRIQKFSTEGVYLTQWGSAGSGDGQFDTPLAVAVDVTGNVYVVDARNYRIQKFDSSGAYLTQWGSEGSADGELNYPSGVAVDAVGNVYVAEVGNHRVQKFDSSGKFDKKWGSYGIGNGEFYSPSGVGVDVAGNVYVTDRNNHRIQKFDSNRTYLTQWGSPGSGEGQFNNPNGIGVDTAGNVYVAEEDNQRIQKFVPYIPPEYTAGYPKVDSPVTEGFVIRASINEAGTAYYVILADGSAMPSVKQVKAGQDSVGAGALKSGNMALEADTEKAVVVNGLSENTNYDIYIVCEDSSGAIQEEAVQRDIKTLDSTAFAVKSYVFDSAWGSEGNANGQFKYPTSVALDAAGNTYVVGRNNHRIQKFDSNGNFIKQWGSHGSGNGQFKYPTSVALDAAGNTYVVDRSNHRIQKFDSNGDFMKQWGSEGSTDGQFDAPFGVAVDAVGNVYVSEMGNHRIQKFDSNGDFIMKWGGYGSADGQFSYPSGVAVDAVGNVYVAEFDNRVQKFDSNGIFITKWGSGSTGSGNGQFSHPHGVAVDAAGNVYVADSFNNRIQKFDSNGNYLMKWGSEGNGEGQFNSPNGVAVDVTGNVYVADANNHRIQKFIPNLPPAYTADYPKVDTPITEGFVIRASINEAGTAYYVVLAAGSTMPSVQQVMAGQDSMGAGAVKSGNITLEADTEKSVVVTGLSENTNYNIYMVCEDSNGAIQEEVTQRDIKTLDTAVFAARSYIFDSAWGSNGSADGQFNNPSSIAVDGAGNVYIADTNKYRIQKFDLEGRYLTRWGSAGSGDGQFDQPHGIAVDAGGNVYVADTDNYRIQKFDSNGAYLTQWGSHGSGDGQFNLPIAVAVDTAGNVYVLDSKNIRIQKFDSEGNYLTKWGEFGDEDGQFKLPHGIAVDIVGNVYVAEWENHRIQKFDSEGKYLTKLGSKGIEDGEFRYPKGVGVDAAGNVYVADTHNNRIQKFASDRTFIAKWGSHGSGDGQFDYLNGIAVDTAGNVYVADGAANHRVQRFIPNLPPEYTEGYPKVDTPTPEGFTIRVKIDEAGTAYYVVLVDGAAMPSVEQVMAGQDSTGADAVKSGNMALEAVTEKSVVVTGLIEDTEYDVYLVCEGSSGNTQHDISLYDIKTALSDGEAVVRDKAALTEAVIRGSNSSINNITTNLNLITAGSNGTAISWSSSEEIYVTVSGAVNRPAYGIGDKEISLTATITKGAASDTKAFVVTVKEQLQSDAQAVAADKATLTETVIRGSNSSLNNITTNLNLVTAGSNGTAISWSSSEEIYVTPLGEVNRPTYGEGDKEITLIATITKGAASDTKAFVVTVKEMIDDTLMATAEADTLEPTVGAANTIILTVKDSFGMTDISFSGSKNVIISGIEAAPNDTYGRFNDIELDVNSRTGQAISVTFTDGVATPSLSLNKAGAQIVAFSIEGVTPPETNNLSITPTPGTVDFMELTQNITAPLSNGGNFDSQPKVTLKDAYGNICINDSSTQITASKEDTGDWALTGSTTVIAEDGVASFTDLRAINNPQIDDAQLAFNVGLIKVTSVKVSLPAANSYTVSYQQGAHGSLSSSSEVVYHNSSPVNIPTVTADAGYGFAYWSSDGGENKLTSTELASETITADITFTAYYTQVPVIESAVAGSRTVDLHWSGGEGATEYKIYQSTVSGSYGEVLANVNRSVLTYQVAELTNGTTYYYAVTAVTSEGETPKSVVVSAMPLAGDPIMAYPKITTFDYDFTGIRSMGVDSEGNIYAVDGDNDRVIILDSEGNHSITWDNTTLEDLDLQTPMDIAIDNNDNVYIADTVNKKIKMINNEGVVSTIWGPGEGYYNNVAVNPDGSYVYFTESGNNAIQRIDANDGTITEIGAGKFSNPGAVALDSDGNIYVAEWNNSQLKKIDTNGNVVTVGSGFNNIAGIVVDSSGNIFVTERFTDRVKMIVGGQGDIVILGSGFSSPRGIDLDSSGNIYVANNIGGSIQKILTEDATSATAKATTMLPTVGADNSITLTVKNSFGLTDTSFAGSRNVTISGVRAAPNGTYGYFNGVDLDANSVTGQTISVSFTDGVASVALSLNKAGPRVIAFDIEGVSTPATNDLIFTLDHGDIASIAIYEDIEPPSFNGGPFHKQPAVSLLDYYGNYCTKDNSTQITASKHDKGLWSLIGNTTLTAEYGVVSFLDLRAINNSKVSGAQLAFNASGLTGDAEITSAIVTLPEANSYTVTYQQGDHGTLSSSSEVVYHNSSPINIPTVTADAGYVFAYWSSDGGATQLTSDQLALEMITADTTYTAYYTDALLPGAPTAVTATAGNRRATIRFSPPADDGGASITSYLVTASPGGVIGSGASSPIAVTGLTNGTAYTFTVKAVNVNGEGLVSEPSNRVTPYKPTSSSPSTKPSQPAEVEEPAAVLVNGETQNLATEVITQEGPKTVVTVTLDKEKVQDVLQEEGSNPTVTVAVNDASDTVITQLTGETVQNMAENEAVLEIKTQNVVYTVPVAAINMENIVQELGSPEAEIVLDIQVSEPTVEINRIIEDKVKKHNYQLIVQPVEFNISATEDGKTVVVAKYNSYVERMIALPDVLDPNTVYTALVLHADGSFSPVPMAIITLDGKNYARISSLTNSVYTVIGNKVAFSDVQNHWAQETINNLGSRLIVSGIGDNRFEPNRDVTRAEFVTMVVRALGLRGSDSDKDLFQDVPSTAWYYNTLAAAYEHEIISGYLNSEFRPVDKITREQAMTIIARAMKITEMELDLNSDEVEELLSSFEDGERVADYARNSVAACVKAGIVTGRNGKLLAPKDNITRAEAASMITRLLEKSDLI